MTSTLLAPKPQASALVLRNKAVAISRGLRKAARQAREPHSFVSGGGVRMTRGDRIFRQAAIVSFFVLALLPILGSAVYLGLIAANQYSTETKFAVRTGDSSGLGSLGGLVGAAMSQQGQDTLILANYLRSRAAIDRVDADIDLRKAFSRREVDYFSAFDTDSGAEELEKYWKKHVFASSESTSGLLTLEVRAFTAKDSYEIAKKLVSISEELVNDLANGAKRDRYQLARLELERAEAQMVKATDAMRDQRNAEGVLDAAAAAASIEKLLVPLRLELSRLEQEAVSQKTLSPDSPQKRLTQGKIDMLKTQIADYTRKIAGGAANDGSLASRAGSLSRPQLELDLARQQYAQASVLLETSRVDLEARPAYLAVSQPPLLAQTANYPKRWTWFGIICASAIFGWLLLVGAGAMIKDNMA